MARILHNRCLTGLGLAGLLLWAANPAQAAWIGYKNDTQIVVVVQGAGNVNGQIRKGQPHQINPKEAVWDQVTAGLKTITVFDPRQPNRVLWQGQINIADKDMCFSIQVENGPDKQPRMKLIPVAVPAKMTSQRK